MTIEQIALSHFQYLDGVDQFISGLGPEPKTTPPDKCALGQWLKENPNPQIAELHDDFHRLSEEAIEAKKRGDAKTATELLNGCYIKFAKIENILFNS